MRLAPTARSTPRDRTRGRIFVGALKIAAWSIARGAATDGEDCLSIIRVGSSGSSSTEVSLPARPVGGGSDLGGGGLGGPGGGDAGGLGGNAGILGPSK